MVNPKCKSCGRYIRVIELKSSGEPYKSCNKCRDIQKKTYNKKNNKADVPFDIEIKKEPDKKYANIEDMPDENIVIPYECCNEIE
tara:strand:- start:307 stop:561 length:255 start_codon:yes stop_codon:yes gene_type:complete